MTSSRIRTRIKLITMLTIVAVAVSFSVPAALGSVQSNDKARASVSVYAAAKSGWVKSGKTWKYYQKGAAVTGWKKISGKWYYFAKKTAVMQTGWQKLSGKWYYLGSDGKLRTGWQKISGKWYHFGSSGAMQTGYQTIGGKDYAFSDSGVWKDPEALGSEETSGSTASAANVTGITITSMYYSTLPNGGADYATINWTISGSFGKAGQKVAITERMKSTDYIYASEPKFNISKVSSVTLYNTTTWSGSTRVYAVTYNGEPGKYNLATYTISAGDQSRTIPIGFRAGCFDDPRASVRP